MGRLHRLGLELKHLDLVPHRAAFFALFAHLLVACLHFLDYSGRLFQLQCELLDQAVFRLDLLDRCLISLLSSDLETVSQPTVILLQHVNVSFVRFQLLLSERFFAGRLHFESLDLLLELEDLVLELLLLLIVLPTEHVSLVLCLSVHVAVALRTELTHC